MSELIHSILLGLIQGFTEFLPVSSSGHLAIFKILFHMEDAGIAFDILLHIGTLVAVFIAFWSDIWKLIVNGLGILGDCFYNIGQFFSGLGGKEKNYRSVIRTSYRKFAMLVIVSTIPTAAIGLLIEDISDVAGDVLIIPGICLLITAMLCLISDNLRSGKKTPKNTTYKNALTIGVVQGLAVMPGISRSGSTITACILCGLDREFAFKYSFILSIPAILGAAVLKLPELFDGSVSSTQLGCYGVGALVAAIAGYLSIKILSVLIKKRKFKYFGFYCIVAGFVSIITYFVA